jgi:hypothetical protein
MTSRVVAFGAERDFSGKSQHAAAVRRIRPDDANMSASGLKPLAVGDGGETVRYLLSYIRR